MIVSSQQPLWGNIMANVYYALVTDSFGVAADVETKSAADFVSLTETGCSITGLEDNFGITQLLISAYFGNMAKILPVLVEFDNSNEDGKCAIYAEYMSGYRPEEFSIYKGDIYQYAQEQLAKRLNMDFDDIFLTTYVNLKQYAHDMLSDAKWHIQEFSFNGKNYLCLIP